MIRFCWSVSKDDEDPEQEFRACLAYYIHAQVQDIKRVENNIANEDHY